MDIEEEESSEALLVKKKKEAKKVKAARQRTQARFEALLNVGSGSEEVSEITAAPVRKLKKKGRTRTADSVPIRKRTDLANLKKNKSRSHDDLLDEHEREHHTSSSLKEKSKQRKKRDEVEKTKILKTKKKIKTESNEEGKENYAFEQSFNNVANDDDIDDREEESKPLQRRNDAEEEDGIPKKKGKGKMKKRKQSSSERIFQALDKKYHDDTLLMCLVIHRCDQLKPDARILHPVVRIHFVNLDTGQYVKKNDRNRNVTAMNENENENIDYILPMMTHPFDLKKKRTLTPSWEETVIYNERYSYFLQREQSSPPVIIFFEVLDFIQMNLKQKEFSKTDKGWYRIAWAFLKLVSPTTGIINTDKRLRLQLYQPLTRAKIRPAENAGIEIYQWWMYGSRQKYSSTIYVTVKGVTSPRGLPPATRSTFPTQKERGGITFEELNNTLESNPAQSDHETATHIWTKLPGQVNHIPNKLDLTLPTGKKGCSVVSFSKDGRYIALACSTHDGYPITVYEFPENKLIGTYKNHFGLIYSLAWSNNGKELISSSADTTVRCWDTKRFTTGPIKIFPHPSYVYTCVYHPLQQNLVITGSYDRTIRIWNKISDDQYAELLKELSNHTGYVNSLEFNIDGSVMFSGDSNGIVMIWQTLAEKKKKDLGEQVNRWHLQRTVELEELKKTAINTLILHPNQMKLLIHSRDSLMRMLDLRSFGILKAYIGGMNFKEFIHCAISTCGSYIFCGTETGLVHVWNTETGDLIYTYKDIGYTSAVSYVSFHSEDNYIAFCSYGGGHPVYTYSYDPSVKANELPKSSHLPEKLLESRRDLEETTELYKSLRTATSLGNDSKRMDLVNERLKSVTDRPYLGATQDIFSTARHRVTFKDPSPRSSDTVSPRQQEQTMLSTWGSDFATTVGDYTATSPGYFMASSQTPEAMYVQKPADSANGTIRDETLTMSQLDDSPARVIKVRALYEYRAARSDELHLEANDIITVIRKDDSDWWFGQLPNGRQGYFPSNYVTAVDPSNANDEGDSSSESKERSDSKLLTNKIKKSHSAVIDKYGELRIISGAEESDSDLSRSQKRRRKRSELAAARLSAAGSDENIY